MNGCCKLWLASSPSRCTHAKRSWDFGMILPVNFFAGNDYFCGAEMVVISGRRGEPFLYSLGRQILRKVFCGAYALCVSVPVPSHHLIPGHIVSLAHCCVLQRAQRRCRNNESGVKFAGYWYMLPCQLGIKALIPS